MNYSDKNLDDAVEKGIFLQNQVDDFRNFVDSKEAKTSGLLNVLYYGGGLLIISALTWLMKSSWDSFGSVGIVGVSALYFIAFFIAGYNVLFKKKMYVAGGILFSVVIAITPLLVFGIMKSFDFWPAGRSYEDYYIWVKGKWIVLEISTFIVGFFIIRLSKFPFHMFLIAFTMWFFSMDIVPVIFGQNTFNWTDRAFVSRIFGTVMLISAYLVDIKFEKDYSFWLYLFGLMTLTSGFSFFYNDDTDRLLQFFVIHILFILISIILERKVFLVFGTIGIMEFLGRVSYIFFKGSVLFPFVLTFIGILLILSGIGYQKNKKAIEDGIKKIMPPFLLKLKPRR